jgi:hypothetical protein
VKATENFVDRAAAAVVDLPPGETLGYRVDVLDVAAGVGRNDAVANRLQRDLCAFFFAKQCFLKRKLDCRGIGNACPPLFMQRLYEELMQ